MNVSLRLQLNERCAIGPGKIKLLETIATEGSISAAGRAMGMSYRRAWILVDDLNHSFREPLVSTQLGGTRGGGATLTALGTDVVRRYRLIERRLLSSSRADLTKLERAAADGA